MTRSFTLFGSEMSPYSHKVRSWLRYKGVPHRWVPSGPGASDPEYKRHARLPIVPTLVWPDGEKAEQDSTPIIEGLEPLHPEPAIQPPGVLLGFLSTLIEEFGDEWGNKLMFHLRWWDDIDMAASSDRAARLNRTDAGEEAIATRAAAIRERMSGRGHFVGSSAATAPLIFDYYVELIDILEPHLAGRRYLFGGRPSFGDFALAAQLYHASSDPTGGAVMRARGPAVLDWCLRMTNPRDDGPFEDWPALAPTLAPLLAYVGRYFLPWSHANAEALARGEPEFAVDLAGRRYVQPPQKYHAKSLTALRDKHRAVASDAGLKAVLDAAGCTPFLTL